ncbi:MAG: hypothetical protein JWO67_6035 [Streptosporangiaceae bacterium]|jgi:hypothetical protein|nr:hypothetical protein [Streptosporangiaceae bacterium]
MNSPVWRKSSHSGNQGDCVELARLGAEVGVRDSKNAAAGHLTVSAQAFSALVARIRAGELQL